MLKTSQDWGSRVHGFVAPRSQSLGRCTGAGGGTMCGSQGCRLAQRRAALSSRRFTAICRDTGQPCKSITTMTERAPPRGVWSPMYTTGSGALVWTLGPKAPETECQIPSIHRSPSSYFLNEKNIHFFGSVDSWLHFWPFLIRVYLFRSRNDMMHCIKHQNFKTMREEI